MSDPVAVYRRVIITRPGPQGPPGPGLGDPVPYIRLRCADDNSVHRVSIEIRDGDYTLKWVKEE